MFPGDQRDEVVHLVGDPVGDQVGRRVRRAVRRAAGRAARRAARRVDDREQEPGDVTGVEQAEVAGEAEGAERRGARDGAVEVEERPGTERGSVQERQPQYAVRDAACRQQPLADQLAVPVGRPRAGRRGVGQRPGTARPVRLVERGDAAREDQPGEPASLAEHGQRRPQRLDVRALRLRPGRPVVPQRRKPHHVVGLVQEPTPPLGVAEVGADLDVRVRQVQTLVGQRRAVDRDDPSRERFEQVREHGAAQEPAAAGDQQGASGESGHGLGTVAADRYGVEKCSRMREYSWASSPT